VLLEIQIWR